MQVAGFGVKAKVNTLSVVTDDVFSPRVLVVAPGNQLMHSAEGGGRRGHHGTCLTIAFMLRASEGLGRTDGHTHTHTHTHTCQC